MTTKYQRYTSLNLAIIVMTLGWARLILGGEDITGYLWTYPIIITGISVLAFGQGIVFSLIYIMGACVIMFLPVNYIWLTEYTLSQSLRYIMSMTTTCLLSLVLIKIQEKTTLLLKKQTVTDNLTGLFNRSILSSEVWHEFEKRNAEKNTFLLLIDIDYFKNINDTFGHDIGDQILVILSSQLKQQLRENDFAIRWGGEEFLVILQNCNYQSAINKAEDIRQTLQDSSEVYVIIKQKVTLSIGVSLADPHKGFAHSLKQADTYLYEAKGSGRNKVVHYDASNLH
jgi:diguanylate cyclase (GGDEF)-like protein